jgi:hypothetical protein
VNLMRELMDYSRGKMQGKTNTVETSHKRDRFFLAVLSWCAS